MTFFGEGATAEEGYGREVLFARELIGECQPGGSGYPHISYYQDGDGLKHARRTGSQWLIQVVEDGWLVGSDTSLARAADRPRFGYHDGDFRALWFAFPIIQVYFPIVGRLGN